MTAASDVRAWADATAVRLVAAGRPVEAQRWFELADAADDVAVTAERLDAALTVRG